MRLVMRGLRARARPRLRAHDRHRPARRRAARPRRDRGVSRRRDRSRVTAAARARGRRGALRPRPRAARSLARRRGGIDRRRARRRTAPARRRRCARSRAWCGASGSIRFAGRPLGRLGPDGVARLGIAHVPGGPRHVLGADRLGEPPARRLHAPRLDPARPRARLLVLPLARGAARGSRPGR